MSIYRSEIMHLYHIAMNQGSAYEVLSELGDLGMVQFIDQNNVDTHTHRAFSQQIKRCEDLLANVQLIEDFAKKFNIPISKQDDLQGYLDGLKQIQQNFGNAPNTYIDQVEEEIQSQTKLLTENIENLERFKQNLLDLHEYKYVINQFRSTLAENIFSKSGLGYSQDDENNEGVLTDNVSKVRFLAGAIETQHLMRFKRMIFRSTRGNCFVDSAAIPLMEFPGSGAKKGDMEDQETESTKKADIKITKQVGKSSFIVIFHGGETHSIQNKIIRIADSFQANRYPLPSNHQQCMKKVSDIDSQFSDQANTMQMTQKNISDMLKQFAAIGKKEFNQFTCSQVEFYKLFILREKCLYSNMNLLDVKGNIYQGQYWAPANLSNQVDNAISALNNRRVGSPHTTINIVDRKGQTPPTFFQTNEFTAPFQQIVDTYGIARYQEVNPGIYCVSMFPLKFGIMFGDIGHGGLLLIVGILLTKFSDTLKKAGQRDAAEIRYLILLMGICAFYCGWIYNDFFSLTTNLFGSCFEPVEGTHKSVWIEGCTYPFGLDPKWYVATNELTFMNSLKMKLAVIIGVVQMGWGVILKGSNHLYKKEWVDFIFEFIPQFVFLMVTFGYMDFLIFYKWTQDYTGERSAEAPSIINQMINLPLKLGSTDGYPLWNTESQEALQFWFLIVSLICVPLMLLPKPFILLAQSKLSSGKSHTTASIQQPLIDHGDEAEQQLTQQLQNEKDKQGGHGGHGHGEEFEFGEVFVHSVIETIEFVLGCISNTASYLRLWALSLAHGQLAKVFFEKTLGGGIQSANVVSIMIGWVLFVTITLGVIMAMDLMECFLHALRLQWVEFQNKFYRADGYAFQPFSFVKTLKSGE